MDKEVPNDRIDNRRKGWNPKPQIVRDCDQHALGQIRECPDDTHSFCPVFHMMKTNLELVAIDDLLGRPRDRNAGSPRGHYHDVAIRSALQKFNVAIMRENFRPELQVCSRLEDRRLRRVHENGIGLMHEQIETAQRLNVARLLPNTPSSSKIILMKEENRRMPRRLADPQ